MGITEQKSSFMEQLEGHFPGWEISRFWDIISQEYSWKEDGLFLRKSNINSDSIKLDHITERLLNNEPIDYIIGYKPFLDLDILVDNSVLIPRPETEEWVYDLIQSLKHKEKRTLNVLEIGSGSGCISLSMKKHLPHFNMTAIDISADAIDLSRKNGGLNDVEVDFKTVDFLDESIWSAWAKDFDLILSNPPYIDRSESDFMDDRVIQHEPDIALYALGGEPLVFYHKIVEFAQDFLKKEGSIYLECNALRAVEIRDIFTPTFEAQLLSDMQGNLRVLKANKLTNNNLSK